MSTEALNAVVKQAFNGIDLTADPTTVGQAAAKNIIETTLGGMNLDTTTSAAAQRRIEEEIEIARRTNTRKHLASLLDSETEANLFHVRLAELCRRSRRPTGTENLYEIPNVHDIEYNLVTYSLNALERLRFKPQYTRHWVNPKQGNIRTDRTHVIILRSGYLCWGTYNSTLDEFKIKLSGSEVTMPSRGVLAINTYITDGEDFLRGVPLLTYDGLGKIVYSTDTYAVDAPRKAVKSNSTVRKNAAQKAARRRNRK